MPDREDVIKPVYDVVISADADVQALVRLICNHMGRNKKPLRVRVYEETPNRQTAKAKRHAGLRKILG